MKELIVGKAPAFCQRKSYLCSISEEKMAEAILFCALERIGDLLIQQADFLGKVGDDVQLLQTELRRMQ